MRERAVIKQRKEFEAKRDQRLKNEKQKQELEEQQRKDNKKKLQQD